MVTPNAAGHQCKRLPQNFRKEKNSAKLEPLIKAQAFCIWFRVKAPLTRRPPHRSVREAFPHTVPRFRPFLPSRQPIRRHPDWRITLLPCMCSDIIMDYSGAWQRESPENSSKLLMTYIPTPVASAEPASPRFFSVFVHHL